ncbi:MAG: hypothetical protein ACK4IY_02645, partial [Chitinophagales bacterium]
MVAVYDMAIHPTEHDLILATHGRGIIIIDDLTPIRALTPAVMESDFTFLPNRAYEFPSDQIAQDFPGDQEFVGRSTSSAASIAYFMGKRHVFGEMYLEVYDNHGNFLKKLPATGRKGLNLVAIDTRMKAPKVPQSVNVLGETVFGPAWEPGTYRVKLIKGDTSFETDLVLHKNPANPHTDADMEMRRDVLMQTYALLEHLSFIDRQITDIRDQTIVLADMVKSKGMRGLCFELNASTAKMHEEIVSTQQGEGAIVGQVRLREKIGEVYGAVMEYGGRPTEPQIRALNFYVDEVKKIEERLNTLKEGQLKDLNAYCLKQNLPPVTLISKADFFKIE